VHERHPTRADVRSRCLRVRFFSIFRYLNIFPLFLSTYNQSYLFTQWLIFVHSPRQHN
jgi:hypothetical protein